MGNVVGRLFREFAVTLAVTIIISAVVSLTLGEDANRGASITIGVLAAAGIVVAVVLSKRRSTVIGDDTGPSSPPPPPPATGSGDPSPTQPLSTP